MRGAVDLKEAGEVDLGVALGGRQGSVAQQFLDGAEIGALGQQVRGKAVTKRVRRRRLR